MNKFLDGLIEVCKDERVFKFLHVPVQSGSDKVLKDMHRNYTVADFKRIINKFREEIPEIHISTDIIVGFPGESEAEFLESVRLVEELNFEVLNISKFGAMPRTKAAKMKQLNNLIIKERSRKLSEIYKNQIKDKKNL